MDTAHCGVGGVGGATDAVWRFYRQSTTTTTTTTTNDDDKMIIMIIKVVQGTKGVPRNGGS